MRKCLGRLATAVWAIGAAVAPANAQQADDSAPDVRHSHAHSDRVIVAPSAETHPEATVFLSTYDIALLQAGYAPSDRLQVSLTGLVTGQFFELNVKANLLRSESLRVAVLSSIDYARGEDDEVEDEDEDELQHIAFGRVGSVLQLCLSARCLSSFNLGATIVIHDQADIVLPVGIAAGLTAFVSDNLSLLLEYSSLLNASQDLELIDLPLYLVAYGARISGNEHWALDVTLLRPLRSDDEIGVAVPGVFDLLGLPLLAFTYRFAL